MKEWSRFAPSDSVIWEDEQGIITATFGTTTVNEDEAVQSAHWLVDTFAKIKAARPDKPIRVLLDMTNIDDSELIPGEAWKIHLALVKDPYLQRVVVVGGTEAMSSIINFYFRFWQRKEVKFVASIEEARAWLNEK